ncbi:uncharacterized protein MYCFIDRAFT_176973 [Pseudocercospora fijiensis CIRAD86]|uniref:Uncharacterized protein n=1 Tax=Pseudocercospora fijiensis (strain CIRAD86) TaxID=383855 RepID=M3A5R5_PSEFD|nr:uncharacterized protein MYCFIDRAFT_176973 [Pseudocercospora fijiensis CIRAD86]EME79971.1 hypothetical protein MYCFIDRAFT_176973 [Pseudocercospora fijiensis CIRAD86]
MSLLRRSVRSADFARESAGGILVFLAAQGKAQRILRLNLQPLSLLGYPNHSLGNEGVAVRVLAISEAPAMSAADLHLMNCVNEHMPIWLDSDRQAHQRVDKPTRCTRTADSEAHKCSNMVYEAPCVDAVSASKLVMYQPPTVSALCFSLFNVVSASLWEAPNLDRGGSMLEQDMVVFMTKTGGFSVPDGDEHRVVMLDFALCRFRKPEESDAEWGRAQWRPDEEGAIGAVVCKQDWPNWALSCDLRNPISGLSGRLERMTMVDAVCSSEWCGWYYSQRQKP